MDKETEAQRGYISVGVGAGAGGLEQDVMD